jgi:hypothetical protein
VHDEVEPFPLRHPRYLELYLSDELKLDDIITASLPRERINDDWRMFFTIGGTSYVLRAVTPHSTWLIPPARTSPSTSGLHSHAVES